MRLAIEARYDSIAKKYEKFRGMGLLCLVVENLSHIALLGLILLGSNPSQIVGFQRQSPARHIHINPFSSLSQNRISFISSYGNPQIPPVSHVRRDVSLVNIARETENDVDGVSFDSGTINRYINEMDEEYLDDDTGDDGEDEQPNEPICRVVAASDSKIPPLSAYSALSPASKTLVRKLELLYAAQSQKKLREFTYFPYQDGSQVDDVESKDQQLVSTLKQSLEAGGFKLMDQRDFDLCSALNAGYLLRLSLLPDLKDLDPTIGQQFYPELYEHSGDTKAKTPDKSPKNNLLFDGRVLVYRRGYSQEVTTGRLLLPKLDYLQASLVQRSSASLTRKFGVIEQKLEDAVAELVGSIYNTLRRWWLQLLMLVQTTAIDILKSSGILEYQLVGKLISGNKFFSTDFPGMIEQCHLSTTVEMATPDNEFQVRGNRIFRLGRYGVGERYSTFNVIANSLDLSDALSPFSLCEVGSNDTTSIEQDMYEGIDAGKLKCQYDEIYGSSESSVGSQPSAVRLLERVSIQNTVNFFSEYGRRDLIKNYFKKSTLKEPAYEEVVVIWRPHKRKKLLKKQLSRITTFPKWLYGTARIFDIEHKLPKRVDEHSSDSIDDVPSPIEIRAFNDVPMANLPAVLPKTKLIFRPADALVFDLVSIVSFIALGASLKFDNPRLDLLAVVSLSVFAVRTFFRYSNKYARYDLLVNKFLTKKLAHRGSGALNYIVSQADSQRALRSGLIRDWLSENKISMSADEYGGEQSSLTLDYDILELGKSFTNDKASTNDARIDVDIISAIDDLNDLDLLDIVNDGQSSRFKTKGDESTRDIIQQKWNDLLSM